MNVQVFLASSSVPHLMLPNLMGKIKEEDEQKHKLRIKEYDRLCSLLKSHKVGRINSLHRNLLTRKRNIRFALADELTMLENNLGGPEKLDKHLRMWANEESISDIAREVVALLHSGSPSSLKRRHGKAQNLIVRDILEYAVRAFNEEQGWPVSIPPPGVFSHAKSQRSIGSQSLLLFLYEKFLRMQLQSRMRNKTPKA